MNLRPSPRFLISFVVSILMSGGLSATSIVVGLSPGGSYSYAGTDSPAPLFGNNLPLAVFSGDGTLANASVPLACVSCELAFSTGANLDVMPVPGATIWDFDSGGSFQAIGTIPALGITSLTTLFAGQFSGVSSVTGIGALYSFSALSLLTTYVDPALLSFYGYPALGYPAGGTYLGIFAGPASLPPDFAFNSGRTYSANMLIVSDGDPAGMPEPSALLLFPTALAFLWVRRRMVSRS